MIPIEDDEWRSLIKNIKEDQWYTIEKCAKMLRVCKETVGRYLREEKELKGRKKGPKKRWNVKGTEIIRKLKEWDYL